VKKNYIYIIGGVLLALLILLLTAGGAGRPRRMNERISLRYTDKNPYGFYAAYHLLPSLFPRASISSDKNAPGYWDSLSMYDRNQALILPAAYFGAEDYELEKLQAFAEKGNHVMILARNLSEDAIRYFGLEQLIDEGFFDSDDSLTVHLMDPPFSGKHTYTYPGKAFAGATSLRTVDRGQVLGTNAGGHGNFFRFRAGEGSISIHLAPLAFSNYFILHKDNIAFFEKSMSVLPSSVNKIVWDEYYIFKTTYRNENKGEKEPGWLKVLFRYPEFKWALITAFATLLLYALLGMRRRQQQIPDYTKPRNDSLDFVKTLGRLYYDRRDHHNLARKMAAHFLEHVRTRYKMPTQELDDHFVQTLHYKSGQSLETIQGIMGFIRLMEEHSAISESQLSNFHKQLEAFYQNT
jgi:hypothetical protein